MGEETAHVGARIPPAQKDRWKRHQEKSDCETMTEWLKMVVESHIQGYSTPESVASSEDVARVLDELDALRDDVSGIETNLSDVEQAERESSLDTRRVLIELLPDGDSEGITPQEMATRTGMDVGEVRDELVEMQNSTEGVTATIDDGGNHRYRNEADY